MDTSETYIKMCEKANQFLGEPQEEKGHDNGCYTCGGNWYFQGVTLYRQDQLQELRRSSNAEHALTELCELYKFIMDNADYLLSKSREQVELAALMAQKYNKTWNGEDWVGQ